MGFRLRLPWTVEPSPPLGNDPFGEDEDGGEEVDLVNEWQLQDRLWLKTVLPLVQAADAGTYSDRVQYAIDMMAIAACERAVRIVNSDKPKEEMKG